MSKVNVFFIALIFGSLSVGIMNAQTPIVPYLTDKSIKVEMPKYSSISPFIREGLIQINNDNQVAYVNLQGKYVYGFDLKMRVVEQGNGLFDCAAAVRLPQDGSAQLQHAILCQQGRMLPLGGKFNKISDFCDGITAAVKNDPKKYGTGFYVYLDAAGKEILPTLHRKIDNLYMVKKLEVSPLRDDMRAFYDVTLKKWGYADKAGKVIIQPKYGVAMPFSEGLAAVCIQDGDYGAKKWGFIDKTGKEIVPCIYKMQPGSFSDGFAVVNTAENTWSDGAVIFIDKTGKKVSPEYKVCNSFFGGFAYVSNEYGKAMVIDKNFNVVKTVDFPTDRLSEDFLRISEKHPFGLEFINGLAAVGVSDEIPYGTLYTNDGNILFERSGGNAIYNFYDGQYALCRYKIDGKEIKGFVNKKGEFVIYFEENSGFNFITPKPQNAACELCKTNGGGGNDPEPPIPTIPKPALKLDCSDDGTGTVTIVSPLGADYTYSLNDGLFSSETTFASLKQNGVYSVRASKDGLISEPAQIEIACEICDICNKTSKCYDEVECCDEKNPLSRCYEPPKKPILPISGDTIIDNRRDRTIITYTLADTLNHWYSGRVTLNTVWDLGVPQDGSKRKKGGMKVDYKMPATVFMCISKKDSLETLYDKNACGLIWVVPDRGMPKDIRTTKEFAYYWSVPYSIVDWQSDKIVFGAGAIIGIVKRDERDVLSINSPGVLDGIRDHVEMISDPIGFFVKYDAIVPPEKPQTANYKINNNGSMLLTSSTEPLFDNLLLTPLHSDKKIDVEWVGQLGQMLILMEDELGPWDNKEYREFANMIEKEFMIRYMQLKKAFGK